MKEEIKSGNGKKWKFIGKPKANEQIYPRKGRAVTMSLILLLTAFVSLTAFFPTVSAQTQTLTHNDWSGYNGNYTIYMSNVSDERIAYQRVNKVRETLRFDSD